MRDEHDLTLPLQTLKLPACLRGSKSSSAFCLNTEFSEPKVIDKKWFIRIDAYEAESR